MNKRLLYSAILAASISASAQAQVSEPALPSPTQLKLDGTDTVYIYNVKAQQWLSYGNHWGTQLCVKPAGNAIGIAIVPNKKNNAFDGTYTLYNNSNNAWTRKIFMDSSAETKSTAFVDYNNQAAWKTKFVIRNGNQTTFQIQVDTISSEIAEDATLLSLGETRVAYDSSIEAEDKDGNATGTGEGWVSPTTPLASIDGTSADWQAFSKEEFAKYSLRLSTLMGAINEAVESGLDVNAEIAVYNNASATLEELQAAYTSVKNKVRNAVMATADIDNPVDITEYVQNAACESLTGWDIADYNHDSNGNITSGNHGWGTAWQVQGASYTNDDEGVTISKFIERWVNSGASYNEETGTVETVDGAGHLSDSKISQTLTGLPAGGYEVSACVIATQQGRQGEGILSNSGVNLFINDVNNQVYTLSGKPQKKTTLAVVGEDGKLTFGLEIKDAICNWVCIDNVEIKYYGNDATAVLLLDAQSTAQSYESDYGGYSVNQTVMDAFNDAVEAVYALTSSNSTDEIRAAKNALEAAKDAVVANADKYAELEELYNEINDFIGENSEDFDYTALNDFLSSGAIEGGETYGSYRNITRQYSLTTEQLTSYIAELKRLFDEAQKSGIQPGKDIPNALLADPSFENGGQGWSGKTTVSTDYQNCESYMGTFDMYQVISGIPSGVYTVKAQAFQRVAFNATATGLYEQEQENITTYLYGNDIAKKVKSPYTGIMETASEQTGGTADYEYNGGYVANSMCAFKKACDEGFYNNEVSVIVTDGTLRFGIRCAEGPGQGDGWWSIWDNFSVKYEGDLNSSEALAKVTDQLTAEANELLSKKMSADSLNALNAAVEALKANPSAETVVAFNAAVAAAKNSIATYETLGEALTDIANRYESYEYRSEAARTAFATAQSEAQSIYDNGTAKDSEIETVIYNLKKAFTTYLIADDAPSATTSNPVDISYVISNNDFASGDQTGWDGTTAGFQSGIEAMEVYNKDYDVYQLIPGLPAGRYELTVRGFYRQGSNAVMADSINAGTLKDYAVAYINEVEAPLKSVSVVAKTEEEYAEAGISTESEFATITIGEQSLKVPNSMTTAQNVFQNEAFGPLTDVTLSYYAAEAGDIKIGSKKSTHLGDEWTIFDSFTLKYYGNGTDGIESINSDKANTNVIGTQVYNVNGVASTKLQKGLNIVKTTLSDGTVKVSKVIVK